MSMARAGELLREAGSALQAAGIDSARLDAELLLAAAWDTNRTGLVLRRDAEPPAATIAAFSAMLQRRLRREPVSYILGEREFWSLSFLVDPSVLVPRPETECLVERALRHARGMVAPTGLRVADVGTGSGCIAIALASELPRATVRAIDISAAALALAVRNAERLGVAARVECRRGDLLDGVPDASFELIVSNPPYVTTAELAELEPELDYEPRLALDGGADGLDPARRLVAQAERALVPGGWLLFEIGCTQGEAALDLVRGPAWELEDCRPDWSGLPRFIEARRR